MITIGVDAHKQVHVALALDAAGRELSHWQGENSRAGWGELERWAHSAGPARRWGIENAWGYGRGLAQHLVASGEAVYDVNPRWTAVRRRSARRPEKTDRLDARAVALFVRQESSSLPQVHADDETVVLDLLTTERDSALTDATRLRNQIHALLVQLDPQYKARLPTLKSRAALVTLETYASPNNSSLAMARSAAVRRLAQRLRLALSQAEELGCLSQNLQRPRLRADRTRRPATHSLGARYPSPSLWPCAMDRPPGRTSHSSASHGNVPPRARSLIRRCTLAGSIRRQSRGTWEVTVDLGRDPVTKRRRRRFFTVRGKKADAERTLTAVLAQRDQGIDVSPGKITVDDYLHRWLRDYATHNVAPSTLARYTGIVEHHLLPALGSLRLRELRPAHIQAAYAQALAAGSRADGASGGLSPRTVLHHHRMLHEALRHAVELQLLAYNPADAVKPPRPERKEMRVLDAEEAGRLLAAARDTPLFAFLQLGITTGGRLGELLALRWAALDLDAGTMHVARTVKRIPGQGLTFGVPKTHRSRRTVALSLETVAVLRDHRRRQAEERLLLGPAYKDQGLVFASPTGAVWDDSNLRRAFARLVKATDIAPLRVHDLRHTAATLMLRSGVPAKVAAEMLGHATVSVTLDTYSHVLPDMQRQASAMDRALGGRS